MAFVSDTLNFLQNDSGAPGAVLAFAVFGAPLLFLLLFLLLRILFGKFSARATSVLMILLLGYMFFGFITQFMLAFSGVPALKMAFVWLAMVLVYGLFALFNRHMIYKVLSDRAMKQKKPRVSKTKLKKKRKKSSQVGATTALLKLIRSSSFSNCQRKRCLPKALLRPNYRGLIRMGMLR